VAVLFFSVIESRVLMALVFYYKDMLEKVKMQRTIASNSQFFFVTKRTLFKAGCFCRNWPVSDDPVIRISRNLAKKNPETM